MPIFTIDIWFLHLSPTYYGLMYALSFILCYSIVKKKNILSHDDLDSLVLYIFLWVVLWGRFGYVIFYNFSYYISHLFEIIAFWKGGMSFHGGALGVILAVFLFAKRKKQSFLFLIDHIASVVPIWLFFGRIGNAINKELLWFHYDGFLAIKKEGISYFPSPLLEAFLEWIILYFILAHFLKRKRFNGEIGSIFLIFYSVFRIIVELFFRLPDENIGYIIGPFSLGTLLSLPMLFAWIWLYYYLKKHPKK